MPSSGQFVKLDFQNFSGHWHRVQKRATKLLVRRLSYWLLPQIEKADWWSYFCYVAYQLLIFPWACYKYIFLSFSLTMFAQMINSFPWLTIIDHKVQIRSPVSEQWRRYLENPAWRSCYSSYNRNFLKGGTCPLACEQQTHFRSSLLSLRKNGSDDPKCVFCSQATRPLT